MTSYRRRLEAGTYQAETTNTTKAEAKTGNGPTLAELKEQAEQLGLPTYGTKAELQARIDEAEPAE